MREWKIIYVELLNYLNFFLFKPFGDQKGAH